MEMSTRIEQKLGSGMHFFFHDVMPLLSCKVVGDPCLTHPSDEQKMFSSALIDAIIVEWL